jgi:hypothetical protein
MIVGNCPHCQLQVMVAPSEIKWGTLRHAVYRFNFEQVSFDATKKECEDLYLKNLIYGCGQPLCYNNVTKRFDPF